MPPRRKASDEDLGTFGEDEDDLTPEPRAVVRRARKLVAAAPVVERKDAIDEVVSKPIRPGPPPPILYDKPAPRPDYARGRELGALLFFAAAVFVALGLGSYDLRGGADWVGPVGARTAQILVSAVGLAAWAIPVELVLFALPFLRGRPSVITPARAAGDVVLGAVGAALLHVGSLGKIVFGGHTAGGTIGELFGELLRALFSTVGTFLVGLTVVALVLIARATFSFIDFANRTGATSAAVATRAASTVRGVREAWQEAKLLEGGPGAPLVLAGGISRPNASRSRRRRRAWSSARSRSARTAACRRRRTPSRSAWPPIHRARRTTVTRSRPPSCSRARPSLRRPPPTRSRRSCRPSRRRSPAARRRPPMRRPSRHRRPRPRCSARKRSPPRPWSPRRRRRASRSRTTRPSRPRSSRSTRPKRRLPPRRRVAASRSSPGSVASSCPRRPCSTQPPRTSRRSTASCCSPTRARSCRPCRPTRSSARCARSTPGPWSPPTSSSRASAPRCARSRVWPTTCASRSPRRASASSRRSPARTASASSCPTRSASR